MRPDAPHSRSSRLVSIAALWLTFSTYSLLRVPVPGVNEPHYLTKARHFWQPEWCRGDLFLESSNTHFVFYLAVGWLTALFSLEVAAVIGRLLAFLLLAIGWQRLLSRLLPAQAVPLLSAWLFLLLQTLGNLSGEWLVGGVESKTFAYAFAMWSGAAFLAARPTPAAVLLGLAVSFHPVVGCWSALGIAGVYALQFVLRHAANLPRSLPPPQQPPSPVSVQQVLLPPLGFLLAAAPGVVPALGVLLDSNSSAALQANIIQVGSRLNHHLDPLSFSLESYRYFALLIVLWLVLLRASSAADKLRPLTWFTTAALVIALAGLLAAIGPRPIQHLPLLEWRLVALKLYPFRLADLAVPFAASVAAVAYLENWLISGELRRAPRLAVHVGVAAALLLALVIPGRDQNPSRLPPESHEDWLAACRWIDDNAPQSALIFSHRVQWAVKWYAQRPEYVNYKDCPQDAAGIIEWYRRRRTIGDWIRGTAADGAISSGELSELYRQTGIQYLIVRRLGPIDARPIYQNPTFRIYRLGDPAEDPPP